MGTPTIRARSTILIRRVARVLAAAAIEEMGDRDIGEPKGIVELTVRKQAAVRRDPGAVEFQLDPPVESGPQRQLSSSPVAYPTITPRRSCQTAEGISKIGR